MSAVGCRVTWARIVGVDREGAAKLELLSGTVVDSVLAYVTSTSGCATRYLVRCDDGVAHVVDPGDIARIA